VPGNVYVLHKCWKNYCAGFRPRDGGCELRVDFPATTAGNGVVVSAAVTVNHTTVWPHTYPEKRVSRLKRSRRAEIFSCVRKTFAVGTRFIGQNRSNDRDVTTGTYTLDSSSPPIVFYMYVHSILYIYILFYMKPGFQDSTCICRTLFKYFAPRGNLFYPNPRKSCFLKCLRYNHYFVA